MAKIKLMVEGGNMKPGPAVSQLLGPLGINIGKVMSDVNSATSGFKGMNVPVEIDVNAKTKSFTVQVFSPGVSELLKKELSLEKGSGSAKKTKVANIAIEQIIGIAKMKMPNLLAKDLKAAVKLVVGTCQALGILVESKEAKDVEKDIDSGIYDSQIKSEKTELSEDKKKELVRFFTDVKVRQEKEAKVAAEAAAAAEAAKAAAAVVAGTPAPGATPVAGATATPATTGKAAATTPATAPAVVKAEAKSATKKK